VRNAVKSNLLRLKKLSPFGYTGDIGAYHTEFLRSCK
jgi:hypothetical protein